MKEPDYRITALAEEPKWIEIAATWFHKKWNIAEQTYRQSMEQSRAYPEGIPQWYIALDCSCLLYTSAKGAFAGALCTYQ